MQISQTTILRAKAEVIERQRRLELAAQTAGQAAHDIQNIISPILVRTSEIQRKAGNSEALRESVDTIRGQVTQLLDLNGQMLALSRRGRMDMSPIQVRELLDDLADRFPGKRLIQKTANDAWVNGSWSQLSRAISNLLTNAFEADQSKASQVTIGYGTIQIDKTLRCHLGFLPPGRYATIEVDDKGPGISKDILEQIFEPFFSSKRGNQTSGSGLGLSIVAAVVDDHKGILDLRTGPSGTCFTRRTPKCSGRH